jgi:hypothetical protein
LKDRSSHRNLAYQRRSIFFPTDHIPDILESRHWLDLLNRNFYFFRRRSHRLFLWWKDISLFLLAR